MAAATNSKRLKIVHGTGSDIAVKIGFMGFPSVSRKTERSQYFTLAPEILGVNFL
jgi:hypothetical protein